MDLRNHSRKDIGILGERMAAEYLRRLGFAIQGMNIRASFGELDIVAIKQDCLHVIEVKSLKCREFPQAKAGELYGPGENLHRNKIRKVARLAAWYVESIRWEGDWQVDGALLWLRECDGVGHVQYYPQIL